MSVTRYLVVGPSWVGDMVMAQSLFKRLRQQQPEAVIDVLAPPVPPGTATQAPAL